MELPVDIARLVWDEWNLVHTAKHGVSQAEVETVIRAPHVQSASYKGRIVVVGPSGDRLLAVVLGPVPGEPGVFYPFSARPASRQERRHYHAQQGGASA